MILLTGGTGFLGRYILDDLLAHGHKVRMLVRNPAKLSPREGVELVEGDLLDVMAIERAMEGVDKVIHSAATVTFWKKRWPEMKAANVEGTANLVNAALDANVSKFLHVSSVAALGRTNTPTPIDESSRWIKSPWNTQYGRTKYLAELEVQRGVEEGLNAVIVNPAIIIGPGEDWLSGSPRLFHTVAKGLRFYNPGTTGFVPAVDVARAIRLLLEQHTGKSGERFVLVSDSIPYKQFFGWVAQSVNGKAPTIVPPAFLVKTAARFAVLAARLRGQEPLITPETVRISRGHFVYDGSKITRTLPFQYSPLEEVIKTTGAAYLKAQAQNGRR